MIGELLPSQLNYISIKILLLLLFSCLFSCNSIACPISQVRTEDKVEFSEDEEMLISRMFNLVGERFINY